MDQHYHRPVQLRVAIGLRNVIVSGRGVRQNSKDLALREHLVIVQRQQERLAAARLQILLPWDNAAI